jgi:hypothetical protein
VLVQIPAVDARADFRELRRVSYIERRRHLVTAATSVQSCAYRLLCVTIKVDSAAI